MRITSFVLGILGAGAGVAVHAVYLAVFLSQSYGPFQVFLELLLALVLGLAAAFVVLLYRNAIRIAAIPMLVLGALGFFPRPITWLPAGILLISGGAAAMLSLLRSSQANPSRVPANALRPDDTLLHWSEAARLRVRPTQFMVNSSRSQTPWTTRRKVGIITASVIAAVVVIPLSLGTISLNQTTKPITTHGASAGPLTDSTVATTTSVQGEAPATTSTQLTPSTTTTTTLVEETFAWYVDDDYGFTIKFPIAWRNTDPTEVGQRLYHQIAEAYADTFVPVAFADWSSPTFNGCYLDFIWVEVYDSEFMDVPTLPEFRNLIDEKLAYLKSTYMGVESVEPLTDVTIAGMPGSRCVWSILFGGHTLMLMECILVGEERAYFFQFAAVKEDWPDYAPVFDEILRDFMISGPGPVCQASTRPSFLP